MTPQVFPFILFVCFQFCITHAHLSKSTFPLESLNLLNGAKKGDNLKGVHDLKKYLSYLGYLNYTSSSDNQRDEFDNSLEFALRKYQEFYNLNITGVLNNNTLAQMQKCGFLDFSTPGNNMLPGLFHMESHYSFFPKNLKWSKSRLKYAFDKSIVNVEAKKSLERALKNWASSTHFRFNRVSRLEKADIKISFVWEDHGDGYPFVGHNASMWAHTFAPPDGRVHFNAAKTWSSRGDKNSGDIQTVGLHELGHALGLRHSTIREAIMYPIICPGEIKKLHEDDIKGIKTLYK